MRDVHFIYLRLRASRPSASIGRIGMRPKREEFLARKLPTEYTLLVFNIFAVFDLGLRVRLVSFALLGLGLSTIVPLAYRAAAEALPQTPALAVAAVATLGWPCSCARRLYRSLKKS